MNYVICDPGSWQEQFAQTLDSMECVIAYAKNTYLGFRVPYTVADETHEYLPDWIVKVKRADGSIVSLIVECSDFDNDHSGNKDAKRRYLKDYWIPANNLKTYGHWQLLELKDLDELENLINEIAQSGIMDKN